MGSINFKDSIIDGIKGKVITETKTIITKSYNNTALSWTPTNRVYGDTYIYYVEGPYKSGVVLNNFTGKITSILNCSPSSSYKGTKAFEVKAGDTLLGLCQNTRLYSSNYSFTYNVSNVSGEILLYPSSELGTGGNPRIASLSTITITGNEYGTQTTQTGTQIDKVYIGTEQIYPYIPAIDPYSATYFGPTFYWNTGTGTSTETIVMSMKDANTIKVNVNNSWYFECVKPAGNPTIDNPAVCNYNSGGAAEFDLYFDYDKQRWIWWWKNASYLYCRTICPTQAESAATPIYSRTS